MILAGAGQDTTWHQANQQYLMQSIARLHAKLLDRAGQSSDAIALLPMPQLTPPAAIDQVAQLFGLSVFEQEILLLCAGIELNDALAALCAAVQQDNQKAYPTLSLALQLTDAPHWSAFTPEAPLRYWRLLDFGGGNALTTCPLRIDERLLHYLLGVQYIDERLKGIVTAWLPADTAPAVLPLSHQQIADQITAIGFEGNSGAAVQLCGPDSGSKRAIAANACAQLGLSIIVISAEAVTPDLGQLNLLKNLCEREALLTQSAVLLDCDHISSSDSTAEGSISQQSGAINRLIESLNCPLILTSRDRRHQRQRPLITLDIHPPTTDEQRFIWRSHLGDAATHLNGHIDTLVSYFNLSSPAIQAVCQRAKRLASQPQLPTINQTHFPPQPHPTPSPIETLPHLLWDACLTQARPRLDDLAQYIEPVASWGDIVLPEKEKEVLRTIAAHVRQRGRVYEQWGFSGKSRRGLGISAMFAGVSGTGKTMAAEVLANELKLDLYRIDLSSVVSKYIGETEKNLRRVFDAAETGGAILLFDEADALFGKRSEVKDSHDRYANMEVAYLLQRIESYRGLAILTTNIKSSLDQAFLRRIRFIVQFPFPDASQRADIWQRIFPRQTPTQDLSPEKLAKLNVAGGNIRNIALNAAFLAADANEPVQMKHLLLSAQAEYIKLERPLTDAEVKGWLPKTAESGPSA